LGGRPRWLLRRGGGGLALLRCAPLRLFQLAPQRCFLLPRCLFEMNECCMEHIEISVELLQLRPLSSILREHIKHLPADGQGGGRWLLRQGADSRPKP
jgi:hypothetical protein